MKSLNLILALAVFCPVMLIAADNSLLLFSPAPSEEWAGSLSGEYDRRFIGNDLVYLKRGMFKLSKTISSKLGLWGEVGAANIIIDEIDDNAEGDYGIAFGGGGIFEAVNFSFWNCHPFITLRAAYFQSFLMERSSGVASAEIHRRFVWYEGYNRMGVRSVVKGYTVYGGLSSRLLIQDEFRDVRTSGNHDKKQFTYKSGVKPGIIGAVIIPLPNRFSLEICAEAYSSAQRISIALSQYGKP